MAVLFALSLVDDAEQRELTAKLRAVYTFGQPLVACELWPAAAVEITRKVYRHVAAHDPIPALSAAPWGRLTHFGREYRWADGEWRLSETPVAQLASLREVPPSALAFFARADRRDRSTYALAEHTPHHYLALLRPRDLITELGDRP